MKSLKLLAAVALLGIPLAACEEGNDPPPVGEIVGTVSIEGTGIDGVSVNLSNGNTTTTAGGGSYRFDNVEGGAHTVTITGFPSDATFDATSAAATISSAGQSVTINFSGSYIRTASVMGSVTVENQGLPGVTVMLSGVSSATATTDDSGQYAFTGLRMGSYSVEISGFDSDEVGFSATAASVSVGTGESKIVSFDGTYLRTAGIMGRVSVEGEGVEGVNVSLSGGPDNVSETTTTDAAGQYSFAKLRAGDYAVGISGYDTDEYEFDVTSQNVTVALGETATVPFEGILLRTSGISGRVSVEGMGLEGVTVTLSGGGMEDMTAMTDAGGTYAFAGLAAGDYTVSIAIEGDAYVFDSMSMDVTVGDDQTAIVNFEGRHATTASISGMLFVDEATKNDTYDEGEDAFAAAGVPVVLVGPGVNDQMPSATNDQGQFMFPNLKAGAYQLVVPITPEVQMALGDYAYGGPATGYSFDLGVGEAATQAIPFDITHQTVNFSVWLKHGDMTGDALPGATVNLYADQAGNSQVGTGETGEMGVTSIRLARAGTMGNTVFAAIEAEGYDVAPGMQAVMWDPKYPAGDVVTNTADIVNLTADVTFSGATITTAAGGGKSLAGWAVTVTMMEDGEMVAVEGDDVPGALGKAKAADEGMASFMSMAESADDLPMTYYFGVVGDEDQDDDFDGGEMFDVMPMPSDDAMADGGMLKFVHDGLSLAGKMDLGTLEVKYTTQTLVVWTHQEKDQVEGYTRTVSGGDSRPRARVETASGHPQRYRDTGIFFELRHIDDNGRSRPVQDYENRIQHPRGRAGYSYDGNAVYTKVPTDLNIVVKASTDADRRIINNDEAQAWRDFEANKIMGSAFGEHGGFHHTVNLCPETRDDPDQDYLTACSTFAYVWTRDVSGDAMSQSVAFAENPLDGHVIDTTYHSGISVSLNPVARKNVQADNFGATSRSENTRTSARELGTYSIANVGDGEYKLSASGEFWDGTSGSKSYTSEESGTGANVPPGPVTINVTPRSFDIYGTVTDDGVGVEDVEITVGGVTVSTDDYGRYILADATPGRNRRITASKAGYSVETVNGSARTSHAKANGYSLQFTHWPNTPRQVDFVLSRETPTGTVSGTITHLQSNQPIEGVRVFALKLGVAAPSDLSKPGLVQVDRDAAGNAVKTFDGAAFADVDTTDAEGNFSVDAPAGARSGQTTTIFAYRSGMFFTANLHEPTVVDGGEYSLPFRGLRLSAIDGYVRDADGTGMGDVKVTATGGTYGTSGVTREAMTTASGRYNIRVPWGPYDVEAEKAGYTFNPDPISVTLGAEDIQTDQNFAAAVVVGPPKVMLALSRNPISESDDEDTEDVTENMTAVTATLSRAHTAAVVVTVSSAGAMDDGAEDGDFTQSGTTITIAAGETTSTDTVTITAADDDDFDDETVKVSGAVDATGVTAPDAVELTITDDDAAPLQVTLLLDGAAEDKTIEEGEAVAVTATLNQAATKPFAVTVSTGGAGASTTEFGDEGNAELYFAAGSRSSRGNHLGDAVQIRAVNDNEFTGERKVTVTGTTTAEGVMVPNPEDGPLTITITDDDVASVVSLTLRRPSIDEADDTDTADETENATVLLATVNRAHNVDIVMTATLVGDGYTGSTGVTAGTADTATVEFTITAGEMMSDSVTLTADVDDTDAMDHAVTISGKVTAPTTGTMGPAGVTLAIEDDDEAPGAPTGLAADAAAPAAGNTEVTVTLTWTAPDDLGSLNGTDADTTTVVYQVRTKTMGQTAWGAWAEFASAPTAGTAGNAGKLVGTVTSAVNNTHEYQVRAVAGAVGSAPPGPESNTASAAIPAAPTS